MGLWNTKANSLLGPCINPPNNPHHQRLMPCTLCFLPSWLPPQCAHPHALPAIQITLHLIPSCLLFLPYMPPLPPALFCQAPAILTTSTPCESSHCCPSYCCHYSLCFMLPSLCFMQVDHPHQPFLPPHHPHTCPLPHLRHPLTAACRASGCKPVPHARYALGQVCLAWSAACSGL